VLLAAGTRASATRCPRARAPAPALGRGRGTSFGHRDPAREILRMKDMLNSMLALTLVRPWNESPRTPTVITSSAHKKPWNMASLTMSSRLESRYRFPVHGSRMVGRRSCRRLVVSQLVQENDLVRCSFLRKRPRAREQDCRRARSLHLQRVRGSVRSNHCGGDRG